MATPTTWVGSVCSGYAGPVGAALAFRLYDPKGFSSPDEAEETALQIYDNTAKELDKSRQSIVDTGAPDADGGDRLQKAVLDDFDKLKMSLVAERDEIAGLEPGTTALVEQISKIISGGQGSSRVRPTAPGQISNYAEVKKAWDANPTCVGLSVALPGPA